MDKKKNLTILHIEDSDADAKLVHDIISGFEYNITLYRCQNGVEGLKFLFGNGKEPANVHMILLDLYLPFENGLEILKKIRSYQLYHKIPIVIFSSSNNSKEIEEAYKNCVNTYILKPVGLEENIKTLHGIMHYWIELAKLP